MELGLLALRMVVGGLFAGHGAQKLFGWFGGHGPDGTGQFFESIGLRPGRRLALLAGGAELTGGLLLALGLVVPAAAALLSAVMVVAIWTVHRANGPWVTDGGWEYNAVLLAVAFALTAVGAGNWSLDGVLGVNVSGAAWAVGELAAGVAGAAIGVVLSRRTTRRTSGTRVAAVGS